MTDKSRAQFYARLRWRYYGKLGQLAWVKSVSVPIENKAETPQLKMARSAFAEARYNLEAAIKFEINYIRQKQLKELAETEPRRRLFINARKDFV